MPSLRPDSSFEERLSTWLTEDVGVSEFRRVVRVAADEVLLSKFEEGFAARLHATIARLPELFEDPTVEASYASVIRARAESTRVFCWHEAARNVVSGAVADGRISADEASEVLAGVDSVAALMDSVLWTAPAAAGPYIPGPGECDAYREALAKMAADPGLFTRFYGSFEGRRVVNHCPGATFGRRLFEQAWRICTGVPPPAD